MTTMIVTINNDHYPKTALKHITVLEVSAIPKRGDTMVVHDGGSYTEEPLFGVVQSVCWTVTEHAHETNTCGGLASGSYPVGRLSYAHVHCERVPWEDD